MALGQERADSPYSLPCSSRWALTAAALTAALSLPREAIRVLSRQAPLIGFNVMEALLPSLISKTSPSDEKGTAMGVGSTSQFIGVAIGGLLYSPGGVALGFGGCAALALLWLGISLTMQEPPYVSSLRILLPEGMEANTALEQKIRICDGVSDVLLAASERSVYVKVDSKRISRRDLALLVIDAGH